MWSSDEWRSVAEEIVDKVLDDLLVPLVLLHRVEVYEP